MMNRLTIPFLIFALIASIAPSKAQGPIQVDTSANWQQWISTILGGNCVAISNVSTNCGSDRAARFTQGNLIGLTEGIVLSTGTLSNDVSNTPNNAPAFGLPTLLEGDTLLEAYAMSDMNYQGLQSSYDAARIELDFTPSTSNPVTIRFVFASEEYPMYAPPNPSQFNDIFGFFVAPVGSSSYENIAMVPGTTQPVSIANINPVYNSQFYIETALTDSFVFNGYTTPITATFNAIAGQTYHLIIVISDIGDSGFDSAIFLEKVSDGSQVIQGAAVAGVQPMNAGYMELFGFNLMEGAFPRLDSVGIDTNGVWQFNGVEEGSYLVRCIPDQSVFQNSIPTYFNGEVLWENAELVNVTCDQYALSPAALTIVTGPGGISGTISQNISGGRLRSGSPAPGVYVFLQDSATLEWRGFTLTDEEGNYTFSNLAEGTYYVLPDIAGVPLLFRKKVVITADGPEASNSDFVLTPDGFQEPIITTLANAADVQLTVYPNPASDILCIKTSEGKYPLLRIFDVQGRTVLQKPISETSTWLNVSDLQPGIYMLQLSNTNQQSAMMKWVKL
jgi:hypothetical protein